MYALHNHCLTQSAACRSPGGLVAIVPKNKGKRFET